ncbi:DMT family transporter [Rhodalgimonas zhirmunskyi]|uniref:DMT family transporter n=1 Tax=Rhodalgimonas zhirmunskyi TaxID=2964767 RepID=A0AAJ1UE37_9RHOB|nr:DMT family transporter [Rhodoalgimonas zhirmunskyi]MDQ2095808.1 DMT family transporter [Rhodoalgimonas zhirmunskyi]
MQSGEIRLDHGLWGALYGFLAATAFSFNDIGIKLLSDGYALHQVVLIRSVVGMVLFFAVILPLAGGFAALKTRRLGLHVVRGLCVVFANVFFYLGLSVMDLADAVAIFFVAPLVITLFSVVFLGERVGAWRWAAIAAGFAGVLLIVRPGSSAFQMASLLPLAAAVLYATLHTLTRKIGATESAATMLFYIQMMFILTSGAIGAALGDGSYAGHSEVLEFLTREWVRPDMRDGLLMGAIGISSVLGGWAISQAYRVSAPAMVAPFEYVGMPIALVAGYMIWGDWPVPLAWAGIVLIVGSGLLLIWREAQAGRVRARERRRA